MDRLDPGGGIDAGMCINQLVRATFGLLAGGSSGIGISCAAMLIYDQVCVWTGRGPLAITWSSVLPLGILVEVSMAISMTNGLSRD